MISARTRAGGETRGGSVFRWAPSEKPFSYSKQQRPASSRRATAYPLPRQSFTLAGGHRTSQWPSYPSTPATCPGNDHRPGPGTRLLSIAFRVLRIERHRAR